MSKVLVDRQVLLFLNGETELEGLGFGERQEGKPFWWRKYLQEALAQPAEAEGVEVPVEGYILDNNGYSFTRRREDFWTAKAAIVPLVRQPDHLAALSAVTAERDRLESMLIRTATRHFALQIKDRADDKKLDECLSEGIAMLEVERDQLRSEVEALRSDALIGTDAYRATVYVLRRAACDEVFGVAKLQRVFLLDWQSAERLLKEMVRRGDVEQCAGHGWKFPGAAMAAKEA